MRTEEVDLVQVEVVTGPNPLWLTFSLKEQPYPERICASARDIVRLASPDPERDPARLYLLTRAALLIVDAAQFRGRMREAAAALRHGGVFRFAPPGALSPPRPTGPLAVRRA
jgi:hypothetical protein